MQARGMVYRDEPVAEINVTPMIDVMLVLLIIFMVVTPVIAGAVKLPTARTAAPEAEDRVTLRIDAAGAFRLEPSTAAVPDAELSGRLRAAYAARPDDHVLYLKADRDAPYARVLTALAAAQEAGVGRIGAITTLPEPRR